MLSSSPVPFSSPGTKYSINRIKSFVYYIFSLYDRRVDVDDILPYLVGEDLKMRFPGKDIYSHADFTDWYNANDDEDTIAWNTHEVEVLRAEAVGTGEYRVELDVLWEAMMAKSGRTSLRTRQQWDLVDGDGEWPRIKHHEAERVT